MFNKNAERAAMARETIAVRLAQIDAAAPARGALDEALTAIVAAPDPWLQANVRRQFTATIMRLDAVHQLVMAMAGETGLLVDDAADVLAIDPEIADLPWSH